jgi:hypothetical protein
MKIGHCAGCQARIVWGLSPNEKRMPVDATPVRVEDAPVGVALYTLALRGADTLFIKMDRAAMPPATAVHISHFVTCPKREQFSGSRRMQ